METKEIIALMKACAVNGVTELKSGDLHLSFAPREITPQSIPPEPVPVKIPASVERKMYQVDAEETKKEVRKEEEEDLDLLMIKDPLAYEEQLARGELVDETQLQH